MFTGLFQPTMKQTIKLNQSFFTQGELNGVTQDLNLSRKFAQLLGSNLREKSLEAPTTTFYWYLQHDAEFTKFFTHEESSLSYCHSIADLTEALGVTYIAME